MRSVMAPTNLSWIPSVTMRRDEAVQRWPVEKKAPLTRASTAIFDIGIIEHHHRVLAAHFELDLFHRVGADAGGGDLAAGADRTGEGDGGPRPCASASPRRPPSRGP